MNPEQGEKRTERKRLVRRIAIGCGVALAVSVLVGIIFFFAVLMPAFEGIGDIFDSPVCDPSNPDGIQAVARIDLPPSYSNLWSTCGGMQGWWAEARFEIVPDDLGVFLSSTDIAELEPLTEKPDRIYSSQIPDMTHLASFLYGLSDKYE